MGTNSKPMKLNLNRRDDSIVIVVKHWNKLSREVVKSASLEIFQAQVDKVLSNLLYLTLTEQGS